MPFTPPPYPDKLKRKTWDANKGLLAKAKGFTGMGQAMADLEAEYGKVDWEVFNFKDKYGTLNQYEANGFTIKKLDSDVDAAKKVVSSGAVAAVRRSALGLRDTALATAKDYGSNPLYKKAADLAKSIGQEAERFAVTLNPNSMSEIIVKSRDLAMGPIDTTLNLLKKDFTRLYKIMETAAIQVAKAPTYDNWLAQGTMKACRDFNQVIGNAGKMAKYGADIGGSATEFQSFFDDMNLYARVGCPFEKDAQPEEIKQHLTALLKLVQRGKKLQ